MATLEDLLAEEGSRRERIDSSVSDTLSQLDVEAHRRVIAQENPPIEEAGIDVGRAAGALYGAIQEPVVGAIEAAATIGTGALAPYIGGWIGIGGSLWPGEEGQGARAAAVTTEALTYKPKFTQSGKDILEKVGEVLTPVGEVVSAIETGMGNKTLDATGSETMATIAHTAPTAIMEAFGLGAVRRVTAAGRAARAASRRKMGENEVRGILESEQRTMHEIAEDLRAGREERVALELEPDEKVLAAADEAGIELSPEHYANNESAVRVFETVKAQPESRLKVKAVKIIEAVSERADALIRKMGGSPDRSIINVRVKDEFDTILRDLTRESDNARKAVNAAIDPAVRVQTRSVRAYLHERLKELRGDTTGFNALEKELYDLLNGPQTQGGKLSPTYARLDVVRAKLDKARRRADDSGTEELYAALIRDQHSVAHGISPEVGANYSMARKLTDDIKSVEDQMVALFGKEANKSLLPRIAAAAADLGSGDAVQFRNLMNALPEGKRMQVASMVLNDMFFPVSGKRIVAPHFAQAWTNLNKTPWAKAELFKYMPDAAKRRFESLGRSTERIEGIKKLGTGKVETEIMKILENGSMFTRMFRAAAQTFGFKQAGYIGARGGGAIADVLTGQMKSARRTDALLASDDFANAIANAAQGRIDLAERILRKSQKWEQWKQVLDPATRASIATGGAIPWLMQQEGETQSGEEAVAAMPNLMRREAERMQQLRGGQEREAVGPSESTRLLEQLQSGRLGQ